jgi:hypothetical protein
MTIKLYEDISTLEDDELIERHEEIISILTAGKGNAWDDIISELLELERELTLREE